MKTTQECCVLYWINPRSPHPQNITYKLSHSPFNEDEQDFLGTSGWSKDELKSDVPRVQSYIGTHRYYQTSEDLDRLCANTGCGLEVIRTTVDEMKSKESRLSARFDDDRCS